MNAEISKSELTGMTLNAVNTGYSLPLIRFVNSTVKQFTGTFIHLEMSDSRITVNTLDIASTIFVMISSTVEINNCSFHGIQHITDREHVEQDSNRTFPFHDGVEDSAVIFTVYENSSITIRECLFENIQVDMRHDVSAALRADDSQVEIHNSIFTRNQAQWAVVEGLASNVTVVDSVFSHNTGYSGASINVQQDSSLEVHNSSFTHNNALTGSGIVALVHTSAHVTDTVFSHNTGQQGASINVQQNSGLEVHNSTFTHNNATDFGAGIGAYVHTSAHVTYCVFANNTGKVGASIGVNQNSSLEVHNSTFTHNNATNNGAGIEAGIWTSVYITGSIFKGNRAQFGAVEIDSTTAANITSSVFHRNTAYQGGAVDVGGNSSVYIAHSVFTENSAASSGGAIAAGINVSLHINTSTFNANSARVGGVLGTQTDVNVSLSDSVFNNNRANLGGGVIWATLNTNVVLSRANLSKNTAQQGAAVLILKSSLTIIETFFSEYSFNIIYMNSAIGYMHTCTFINNNFTTDIIVRAVEKSNILLNDVTFLNNKAGGIIHSSMSPVTLDFCQFIGNIITGFGIIDTENALLVINQSLIHNNSIHGNPGISFDNAIIISCVFRHNTVTVAVHALITGIIGNSQSLQVTQSNFIFNHGDVIRVDSTVDVVLNACNFIGNNVEGGTLQIQNDGATLRTSNTTIIAPVKGNKVAAYFTSTGKQITMTDYMTHDTCLISGNKTLNSSSTDTFLQEAVAAGLVVIDNRQGYPYTVTQEETVFASGKCNFTALATICIIHSSLKETQV